MWDSEELEKPWGGGVDASLSGRPRQNRTRVIISRCSNTGRERRQRRLRCGTREFFKPQAALPHRHDDGAASPLDAGRLDPVVGSPIERS